MNSHGMFLRGQDVPSDDFSGDELEVWKSSENLKPENLPEKNGAFNGDESHGRIRTKNRV